MVETFFQNPDLLLLSVSVQLASTCGFLMCLDFLEMKTFAGKITDASFAAIAEHAILKARLE